MPAMTSWLLQGNLEDDDTSDSEADEDFVPRDADDLGSPTGTSSESSEDDAVEGDDGAPSSSSKPNGSLEVQKPVVLKTIDIEACSQSGCHRLCI
ncbi:hypothetical protein BC936DRAFT_142267 [Jimgerdemannia flammicorona]|uniref:Uncharacterized protein n=1 Tax=Jimgerdemannia flammicorona TaxID=994334 RepID=A0A433DFE2_9FUNG|nr:hypothetical protein BC936DRAFT_142267 [Jimgerdemannia flammicorona]